MGLCRSAGPAMAQSMEKIARGQIPVLWLQGQSCSGCSVSLLNTDPVGPDKLLTQFISLAFHQTLSAATGHVASETVNRIIDQGGYYLVVEGAVPVGMPRACLFAEETFDQQLLRALKGAKALITAGTCSSYGGIPAAEGNTTGAISVPAFLEAKKISLPYVALPGCPIHPDWMVGTLAHLSRFGLPVLDGDKRPVSIYGRLVHDQCQRFADYERENFAMTFGDPGCLFKLGCMGPITHADCNNRPRNSGANSCIKSGAPCAGCSDLHFAARMNYPMLLKPTAAEIAASRQELRS